MLIIWGVFLFLITSLAYFGQVFSVFWPENAGELGLADLADEVEPVFFADGRGEAIWDSLTLWMLPVAAILMILGNEVWIYFGLVGGGMYIYFAGRGIATRMMMDKQGFSIGTPSTMKTAYAFLAIWGLAAAVTVVLAIIT